MRFILFPSKKIVAQKKRKERGERKRNSKGENRLMAGKEGEKIVAQKKRKKRGERKRNSKGENRLMAGKEGARRAPSFRDMNLDFWLKGVGKGGERGGGRAIQVSPS